MLGTLWKAAQGDWKCWMCNQREHCPLIRPTKRAGTGGGDDPGSLPGPGVPLVVEDGARLEARSSREAAPQLSPAAGDCPNSANALSPGQRDYVVECLNKADMPQAAPMPNPVKLSPGPGCAPQAGQRWRQQLVEGPAYSQQIPETLPSFNDRLSARSAVSKAKSSDHGDANELEATRAKLEQSMRRSHRRTKHSERQPLSDNVTGAEDNRSLSQALGSRSSASGFKSSLSHSHQQTGRAPAEAPCRESTTSTPAAEKETLQDEDPATRDEGVFVEEEYERRMSSERIKLAKALARDATAHVEVRDLRRYPGESRETKESEMLQVRQQESRKDVESYQELMKAKFKGIGAQGVEKDRWVSSPSKAHAVVDGVAKYHGHCVALNQAYAMPGDHPDFSGDVGAQQGEFKRIAHAHSDGLDRLWPRREQSPSPRMELKRISDGLGRLRIAHEHARSPSPIPL